MTIIELYERMTGYLMEPDDPRRPDIYKEMLGVVRAPTTKDAREFIEWWGWESQQEMDAWIRKARKLYAKQGGRDD